MRKIEQAMVNAVNNNQSFFRDNTSVVTTESGLVVYLHGNRIAYTNEQGQFVVDVNTLTEWPTPTTKSRLRALGFNIETRKGVTYLDGVAV